MAILKVARLGHPVLRAKALPIPVNEIHSPRIQRLIDDMFETMHEYGGIGLAGPQVHEGLRIFVAGVRETDQLSPMNDDAGMPFVALINPEIVQVGKTVDTGWEGCLSIPDIRGQVPRAATIRARGYDRTGQRIDIDARGLPARVLQHENDHLDGILFFDRMDSFETLTFLDEFRRYWAKDDEA
jgi:peptide deformylase